MTLPQQPWNPDQADDANPTYANTDLGNARRLVAEEGDRILYVPGLGWHRYDETRWAPDIDGSLHRLAKNIVDRITEEAFDILRTDTTSDRGKQLLKHAMASQSASRLDALVNVARTDQAVIAHVEHLDTDPSLLNLANGTLNLDTGQLTRHDRSQLITRRLDLHWDPDATAPRFQRFLRETFQDTDLEAYVQRAIGYTLTGHATEQALFMHHGAGLNGKSTLLELIADLLGDYAKSVDTTSLTTVASDRAARTDLVRLRGARYVHGNEIERGAHLAEDLIKRMTGGDRITARQLYQSEIEFRFTGKIHLAVNDLPVIAGGGHAIWRRIRVIPYQHRAQKVDKFLPAALRNELSGVLAWAVDGHRAWREQGLGMCAAVRDASMEYRRDQDSIQAFIAERCERDREYKEATSELHKEYENWSRNEGRHPHSIREFGKRLSEAGFTPTKGAQGVKQRQGLRLMGPRAAPEPDRAETFAEYAARTGQEPTG